MKLAWFDRAFGYLPLNLLGLVLESCAVQLKLLEPVQENGAKVDYRIKGVLI